MPLRPSYCGHWGLLRGAIQKVDQMKKKATSKNWQVFFSDEKIIPGHPKSLVAMWSTLGAFWESNRILFSIPMSINKSTLKWLDKPAGQNSDLDKVKTCLLKLYPSFLSTDQYHCLLSLVAETNSYHISAVRSKWNHTHT